MSFAVLSIFIALHGVCLTSTSLSVREDRRVIAVNDLSDHGLDPDLLVKRSLVGRAVAHLVELVALWLFVARIKLELNVVADGVEVHFAASVRLHLLAHGGLTLDEGTHADDDAHLVEHAAVLLLLVHIVLIAAVVTVAILPELAVTDAELFVGRRLLVLILLNHRVGRR